MKYYRFDNGKMLLDTKGMAKNLSLFIASPSYAGPESEYSMALMQTVGELNKCGINNKIHWHRGNSAPDLARCMCVAEFMLSGMTHLLFVDDDTHWRGQEIVRMLAMDLPVLGGTYPRKFIFWDKIDKAILDCDYKSLPVEQRLALLQTSGVLMTHNLKPGGKRVTYPDGKVIAHESLRLPGGALMIQRYVFEQIAQQRQDLKFKIDDTSPINEWMYAFFQHVITEGQWLGEDFYFCDLAQQCGIETYADCLSQITHFGKHGFFGDPKVAAEKTSTLLPVGKDTDSKLVAIGGLNELAKISDQSQ